MTLMICSARGWRRDLTKNSPGGMSPGLSRLAIRCDLGERIAHLT